MDAQVSMPIEKFLELLNQVAWCCAFNEVLPEHSSYRTSALALMPGIKKQLADVIAEKLLDADSH